MFEQILQNPGSGQTVAGEVSVGEIAELQKSLQAGYETDMTALTGGSALRIQSLDHVLKATVQDNKHFVLYNKLAKPTATAVLDEWTEQSGIGGFFGGTFNTQDGAAMESNGEYTRRTGKVKYMYTYRKIPVVLDRQNNIVDAVAVESTNGAKQLLTDIEFSLFEGNSDVTPLAFDGLRKQLESLNSSDNIIDLAGAALTDIGPIAKAAENIFGYGAFGTPTDIFSATSVQTDLNLSLDPAFRVALDNSPNSVSLGTHVSAIRTSYGNIATNQDVFIRDEKLKKAFQLRGGQHAAIATANDTFKPASAAGVASSSPSTSKFLAAHAGNYYYAVTGINQYGESTGLVTAQVAVGAGDIVTLTIGQSAAQTETGYVIYRSRKGGSNAIADMREMVRIPKTGASTVYVDTNSEIPGSTCAFVLNLKASDQAVDWKSYIAMMKMDMAAVNSPIIPWLQMTCGYLRVTKRQQHVMIKNIVPNGAAWKPFA